MYHIRKIGLNYTLRTQNVKINLGLILGFFKKGNYLMEFSVILSIFISCLGQGFTKN